MGISTSGSSPTAEQIPDVWKLIGWLRESLDELRPPAREQPRAATPDAGATEQPEPRATRPSRTHGARQRRARERWLDLVRRAPSPGS